ncbi:MAG: DnaJ C-terminal domain-containing protein [bacterium]|nr:DnaJ C-terminal domain-containing protein [bacterium]
MEKRDFYEILGVAKNATPEELKRAYRKMALEWHPDRHQQDKKVAEEKFKEINEAYEILSKPDKRSAYDQFGRAAFEPGGMGAGGPFGAGFGEGGKTHRQGPFTYTYYNSGGPGGQSSDWDTGGFADPFEIFEQFFGTASPFGQRQRKPVYSLRVDFMESVKGCEKEVVVGQKHRKIKIPAGVSDGVRIRFDEFDLLVEVKPDEVFQRHGDDLVVDFPLSFARAALGDIISVPTIDGPVKLRIQPGTQPGAMIRLRGKGAAHLRGSGRGDQYVRIRIEVPQRLTPQQKELLKDLARIEENSPKSARGKSWF